MSADISYTMDIFFFAIIIEIILYRIPDAQWAFNEMATKWSTCWKNRLMQKRKCVFIDDVL